MKLKDIVGDPIIPGSQQFFTVNEIRKFELVKLNTFFIINNKN